MRQMLTLRSPGGNKVQANVQRGSHLHRNLVLAGYRAETMVDMDDPERTVHYAPHVQPPAPPEPEEEVVEEEPAEDEEDDEV